MLCRNRSGGAGPVGVGVKISHHLGVEPDAVVTPLRSPKRVLDLDGVASPPQTLVRVDVSKVVGRIFFWVVRVIIRVDGGGVGGFRMSRELGSGVTSHVRRVAGRVGLMGAVTGGLGHQRLQVLLSTLDLLEEFVVETAGWSRGRTVWGRATQTVRGRILALAIPLAGVLAHIQTGVRLAGSMAGVIAVSEEERRESVEPVDTQD